MNRTTNPFAFFLLLGFLPACSGPPPEQDPSDEQTSDGSTGGSGTTETSGDDDTQVTPTTMVEQEGPPYGHPSEDVDYPTYDGFTLWLVEEFEEPLDLDEDPIWTWSDGGLDEGQVRFVKERIQFQDGRMHLVVDDEPPTTQPDSCSHAEVKTVFSKPLTSGELRTRLNLFRYGRYEVRMKAPTVVPGDTSTNGNYIATLFTFRTPKFQEWREIDIEVTGDGVDTVTTNLITADDTFAWNADIQEVSSYDFPGINVREEFHDLAFEWLPDRITWYLDGEVVSSREAGEGLPIPEKSAKIMMNLWVFNSTAAFGGEEIENNQYPMHTEYEWFRFYRWDGDETYPCEDMNELCLSAEDLDLSSNNPCDEIPHSGTVNGNEVCTATCAE